MWHLTAGLALSFAGSPPAEDFEVIWSAPEACPDQASVLEEIRALVDASSEGVAPVTDAATLSVGGVVQPTSDAFEVVLTLGDRRSGAEEVRRFRDPSCATATRMAVLLASVAIRTHREQAERESAEPEAHTGEPEPAVRPADPTPAPAVTARPPADKTRRRRIPRLELSTGLVLDPVSVGALSGGPRVGLRLRWSRAALHVRGMYLAPRPLHWAEGMGAVVSLGVADAQGCWLFSHRRVGVDACIGAEVGSFRARGFGVAGARVDHAFWAAASASMGLSVAVHRVVWLVLEPQLLASLARPSVRFESPRAPIHRAAALGGRVGVTVLVWLRRIRH